jgi:hypothetical protein
MTSLGIHGMLLTVLFGQSVEPSPSGAEQDRSEEAAFLEAAKAAAAQYKLESEREQPVPLSLQREPALHWSNPVGGRKAMGGIYLWTDRGRPEAVLSVYRFTFLTGKPGLHHEFCSLSLGKLTATGADDRKWSPAEPGIQLKPLPKAPAPAASAVMRRRQMRDLAGQFSAEKLSREGVRRSLRLLPQPVNRFEAGRDDLLDGALFAFVEGTDPEVWLLIEARPSGDTHQWQYGLARMTSLQLDVRHHDAPVWSAPTLLFRDVFQRRDLPYTAFNLGAE